MAEEKKGTLKKVIIAEDIINDFWNLANEENFEVVQEAMRITLAIIKNYADTNGIWVEVPDATR